MSHATSQMYQSAIGAALTARDMKQAETWLEGALDQYKDNPSILRLAAQYEQARGNSERAAAYYRAALDAMGPAGPGGVFTQPGNDMSVPGTLSPMQQLMQLLAPAGRTARLNAPVESPEGGGAGDVSWLDAPSKPVPTLGDFAQTRAGGSGESMENDASLRQPATPAVDGYGNRSSAYLPPDDRYSPSTETYLQPSKVTHVTALLLSSRSRYPRRWTISNR